MGSMIRPKHFKTFIAILAILLFAYGGFTLVVLGVMSMYEVTYPFGGFLGLSYIVVGVIFGCLAALAAEWCWKQNRAS